MISQAEMARLTLKLLKLEPPFVIAIDRTEWQLGKSWVNVLMLSISYNRIAIPLFWSVLEEKGCSDNAERQAILKQFIEEFGVPGIRFVTADREFASKEWLAYLVKNKISYRLRIKSNTQITDKRGKLRESVKNVPDNEARRTNGISEKAQIVESNRVCGGLSQRRWR